MLTVDTGRKHELPHYPDSLFFMHWAGHVWMALFLGSQTVGATAVAWLWRIDPGQVFIPILLLGLGSLFVATFPLWRRRMGEGRMVAWVPAILYVLFITAMSHNSFSVKPVGFDTSIIFHPIEYFSMGVFFCWGWHANPAVRRTQDLARRVLCAGAAFAASDEIHQAFVPGRNCSFLDFGLDILGLAAGLAVFLVALRLHAQARKSRPDCAGERS